MDCLAYDPEDCVDDHASTWEDSHDPSCEGHQVLRTNRQSQQRFWGCSRFPTCRHTWSVEEEALTVVNAMTTEQLEEAVAIMRHVSVLRLARESCARATQIRTTGDTGSRGWVTVDISPSEGAYFASAFDVLIARCVDRLRALGVDDPKE
jgi:hypothetical protein